MFPISSEGIGIEVDDSQLMPASQGHSSSDVEIAADIAANRIMFMLHFVDFNHCPSPFLGDHKINSRVVGLGVQSTASEGDVDLVLEGNICLLERLIDFHLITAGESLRFTRVQAAHVPH